MVQPSSATIHESGRLGVQEHDLSRYGRLEKFHQGSTSGFQITEINSVERVNQQIVDLAHRFAK